MTRLEMVRDFVEVCIEQTGEPPSITDVSTALGLLRSTATTYRYMAMHQDARARGNEARRRRYASDPEYRHARLDRERHRYATDPAFRQMRIENALRRYYQRKAAQARATTEA